MDVVQTVADERRLALVRKLLDATAASRELGEVLGHLASRDLVSLRPSHCVGDVGAIDAARSRASAARHCRC
jgi:hypothetical protein